MRNPACRSAIARSTSWLPKSRTKLLALAVATCFVTSPALSNPVNPTVVNGTATFNQAGNVLTVTNSNGAIINWDKFSIKAGETTHFAQASASSSVLNRVLNDPTAIYGTLSSNGRVWLVNPAGIMVGAGGVVNVAGFVASTLNISNADFLAGRNLFANDGTAQNVINQGEIRTPSGGSVYLIGANVGNEGIIHTPAGETILAAGQTVSLIDSATPGVKVDITGAAGNATNLGTITAEAGRIGIAGVIVRNSGLINASSVVSEGGRIFLRATKSMALDETSDIRADGTRGGDVRAIVSEDGVISGALVARGKISAQGDGSPGSGGFVETSAAKVDLRGLRVKTRGGQWLIDPNDITIGVNMYGGDIASALESGDVTIETATQGTPGGNGDIFVNESIILSDGASVDSTLTLAAERSIEVNQEIAGYSGFRLNVNLQARAIDGPVGNVGIYAPITTQGGNLWVGGGSDLGGTGQAIGYHPAGGYGQRYGVTVDYGVNISTGGGHVAMYGRGVHSADGDSDGVEILGTVNAGGGNITLKGVGGDNPTGGTSGVYISGTVQTSGAGSITIEGAGGSNTDPWVANRGVRIDGGLIQAENGSISITGTGGGGNSAGNVGILIDPDSVIETIGNGSIYLTGIGGGGTGRNHGIYMDGGEGNTRISSFSGGVYLTGTAGGHTDSEETESSAIRIAGDSTLSAPLGDLSLESLGGNIYISPEEDEFGHDYERDPVLNADGNINLTTHGDEVFWVASGSLGSSNLFISTNGKNAAADGDPGGMAGEVTLESLYGDVTVGEIYATGGKGGYGSADFPGGKGGKGGEVYIRADNGMITVVSINVEGGSNWMPWNSEGGDGGSITLNAQSLSFNTLSARGGDGAEGNAYSSLAGGNGGMGGSISLGTTASTALGGDIDFTIKSIDARGGDGGVGGDSSEGYRATAGGNGGKGGKIDILATNAKVLANGNWGSIDASGGTGGEGGWDYDGVHGGGRGGDGGDAGGISLTGRSISLSSNMWGASVQASGGDGGEGGRGDNTGSGGTASYTVKNADGVVICGGPEPSCAGGMAYGGHPMTTTQIWLPTSGTNAGPTTKGGRGGDGGHAGNLIDDLGYQIPNLTLVATDPAGTGIQLGVGAYVESMGGDGGQGGRGRDANIAAGTPYSWYQQTYSTPTVHTVSRLATYSGTGVNGNESSDGGWGGQNGWAHMESQNGISQPINNGDGSFRTGRVTFPYDVEDTMVRTSGSVSFLGQNNFIESVSGRVQGDFVFDGRGDLANNSSRLWDLGTWWDKPLVVGGNLTAHSQDNVGVINATVGGSALILSDGSIWTYNAFSAADVAISAIWDVNIEGSVTAGGVIVAAGRDLTISGSIESTSNGVDLRAGSTYDCPDGCNWVLSTKGGNILLALGSAITAYDDIWIQATGDTDRPGDITQLAGSDITSDWGKVNIVAERDISLAGAVSAPDGATGGVIIVAAGRDLTVSGTISAALNISLGGGMSYDGSVWTPTGLGGDVLLTAASSVVSDGDLWISGVGSGGGLDGSERVGNVQALGTLEAGMESSVSMYAWGNLTVKSLTAPSASVDLKAGYDWYDDSPNPAAKTLTLGRIDATGGTIDAFATGAILDGNAFNETNLFADTITLTSAYGGASGDWAISLDVETTGSITANVNSDAAFGGIYVRNWALQPSTVALTDASMSESAVKYFQYDTYDMTAGANSFNAGSGDIDITAGGNLLVNPVSIGGMPAYLYLTSLTGDLSLADALNTTGFIGLRADGGVLDISQSVSGLNVGLSGATINIGAAVTAIEDMIIGGGTVNVDEAVAAEDIVLSAATLNISASGGITAYNQRISDLLVTTTGDVNIDGGYIHTEYGDVQMIVGGNLNMTGNASYGGYIWAGYGRPGAPYNDVSIAVGGNLVMTNGAYIGAGNDIYVDLLGQASTLDLSGGVDGSSYIISNVTSPDPLTTHLSFATRTAGGIVIDGKETTTSVVGGSGFFTGNLSTPATAGFGLDIQYAAQANDSIAAQIANSLKRAIDDASISPTEDEGPGIEKDKSAKTCSDGDFGCEDGSGAGDKKDEKPAQRKVAQCT